MCERIIGYIVVIVVVVIIVACLRRTRYAGLSRLGSLTTGRWLALSLTTRRRGRNRWSRRSRFLKSTLLRRSGYQQILRGNRDKGLSRPGLQEFHDPGIARSDGFPFRVADGIDHCRWSDKLELGHADGDAITQVLELGQIGQRVGRRKELNSPKPAAIVIARDSHRHLLSAVQHLDFFLALDLRLDVRYDRRNKHDAHNTQRKQQAEQCPT